MRVFPISVSLPVAVTIITPLPCVTGVCMNAMFVWSPGPRASAVSVGDVLGRGRALAGQRGLVDLQRARRDDSPVGGDLIACRDQDKIADDELLGGDLRLDSVAPHARGLLHHRPERVHRAHRLPLLAQADDCVEQRDLQAATHQCSIP